MLPVNGLKVLLQVVGVHVGLAQLQLGPRVVVNVVDAHFVHDAKTSLRRRRDRDGEEEPEQMWADVCRLKG